MIDEVLTVLRPRPGGSYLDGTVGGGGHSEGLLDHSSPDGRLLCTDADPDALERASKRLIRFNGRVIVRQAWLDEVPAVAHTLGYTPLDGALVDLGLSSDQLDNASRGFSFMHDGPLDMRFDPTRGYTAAQLINQSDVAYLTHILREYGEVLRAGKVAEAIWSARPISTTFQLRDAVAGIARSRGRIHPATQVFQALRIAANDELRRLSDALPQLVDCLAPGGRLAVITFHSLEDRIVKQAFRRFATRSDMQPEAEIYTALSNVTVRLITHKPIMPSEAEVAANARARSAKLRVVEKLG